MMFLAEIRKQNLSNKDIIPYINCVINDYSVKRETIIGKFNIQSLGDEYISNKIRKFGETKGYKKTFIKSVNNLIYKENKEDGYTIML